MMFTKILVAHDGSEHGWKALSVGLSVAAKFRGAVHCVSVKEKLPVYAATVGEVMEASGEMKAFFDELTARANAEAEKAGVSLTVKILSGHEVQTIIEYAKSGKFDLMIIGFMGLSSLYDRIWGSTSQNLTRLSPCTVMIVK
ncbi:MAG: universal stress protein [Deltaproteobacteria bacterium]|nr:universal stress protein [Deltaproteobacteria bacterium]